MPKHNKSLVITQSERNLLLELTTKNDGKVLPSIQKSDIIQSLYIKGFLEKNKETKVLQATSNVIMLVEMEGVGAFDEIVE